MKVVWNLQNTCAIPVQNINAFDIIETKESSSKSWKRDYKRYTIVARFTFVFGDKEIIYTADTMEECEQFIDSL